MIGSEGTGLWSLENAGLEGLDLRELLCVAGKGTSCGNGESSCERNLAGESDRFMDSLSVHAVGMPKSKRRASGLKPVLWCAQAGMAGNGQIRENEDI